jgi:hypothetical protein
MVIGWKYWNKKRSEMLYHLSVYDLEAVKNLNSDPNSHLLYTLQFQLDTDSFVMDESEIAFIGEDGKNHLFVTVLKFVNFGFVKRESSNLKEKNCEAKEDIKMEIIYDPCVESFP